MDKLKERKEELSKRAEELASNIITGEKQIEQMKTELSQLQGAIAMCNELEKDSNEDKSASKKKN